VRSRGRTSGVAGVVLVYHTLAEPEDYLLRVILIRACLCDVALNDALCDSLRDFFWRTLSVSQWYCMSIAFDRFCLIVSFTMPYAVELSVRRGVGGVCGPAPRV
jgi:hypothetical protein